MAIVITGGVMHAFAVYYNEVTITVSPGERVIIASHYNDFNYVESSVFDSTLVDEWPLDGFNLNFTNIGFVYTVIAATPWVLGEMWISNVYTGPVISRRFQLTMNQTTSGRRNIMKAFTVSGLHTDDGLVVEDVQTTTFSTGLAKTTGIVTPGNAPNNSLIMASWCWNDDSDPPTVPPDNGFVDQGWYAPLPATPDSDSLTVQFASKISSNPTEQSTVQTAAPRYGNTIIASFKGAALVDTLHNTDVYTILGNAITHQSDTLAVLRSDVDHSSDILLKGTLSEFHNTDILLKGTLETQHQTDLYVRPPPRVPILRTLLVNKVPKGDNIGEKEVKILGMNGNSVAQDRFTYVLDPQEFVVGKNQLKKVNIIDSIVKKGYESTIPEEALEPAGQIPLDNLEFQGFPTFFAPFGDNKEEFVEGWINYARMSDDPVEENFEEEPLAWNDPSTTRWTRDRISPDDFTHIDLQFTNGNNPGVPVKSVEDVSEWYPASPVSFVQTAGFSKFAGEPLAKVVSFDTQPSDGNILIVAACTLDEVITSITQSGVTWSSLSCGTSFGCNTYLWVGHSLSGADQSLTLNFNLGTSNAAILIAEISGLDPTATVEDAAGTGTDFESFIVDQTGIPSRQNGLWLSALGIRNSDWTSDDIYDVAPYNKWNVVTEQVGNSADQPSGGYVILYSKVRQGIDRPKIYFGNQMAYWGSAMRVLNPV